MSSICLFYRRAHPGAKQADHDVVPSLGDADLCFQMIVQLANNMSATSCWLQPMIRGRLGFRATVSSRGNPLKVTKWP